MSRPAVPPIERFWDKVEKTETCWLWTGWTDHKGYGVIAAGDCHSNGSTVQAHIVSWEAENGPVPEGLMLDHLCEEHPCVRPSHLEPVTNSVNLMRAYSVWCKKKLHRMDDPSNVHETETHGRVCKKCSAARGRAYYWRQKAKRMNHESVDDPVGRNQRGS